MTLRPQFSLSALLITAALAASVVAVRSEISRQRTFTVECRYLLADPKFFDSMVPKIGEGVYRLDEIETFFLFSEPRAGSSLTVPVNRTVCVSDVSGGANNGLLQIFPFGDQ